MRRSIILLILQSVFFYLSAHSLELKRVILATNDNPTYIQFWPIVAPIWTEMGIRPTLALIADENCIIDSTIGDVIRFQPIPDIPESLQAQVIRLFLPALFPEDGCLISDIDMIPISRSYFLEGAAFCPDEGFLVYRDKAYKDKEKKYPMCYVAAKGNVFASIFGISNPEDIYSQICLFANFEYGWTTDEILLYHYLINWEKKGGDLVRLGHIIGPRLDRINWDLIMFRSDIADYIDCHCPRPYSEHRKTIDQIIQSTLENLRKEKK